MELVGASWLDGPSRKKNKKFGDDLEGLSPLTRTTGQKKEKTQTLNGKV